MTEDSKIDIIYFFLKVRKFSENITGLCKSFVKFNVQKIKFYLKLNYQFVVVFLKIMFEFFMDFLKRF